MYPGALPLVAYTPMFLKFAADLAKDDKPNPQAKPGEKVPSVEDQNAVKNLENNKAAVTGSQVPKEQQGILAEVKRFESALKFAALRNTPQSRLKAGEIYGKAQAAWQGLLKAVDHDKLFGGSKRDFLEAKLNQGTQVEQAQAALWILGDKYGSKLGSFGTAGIDGKAGYCTHQALEAFKEDYKNGKFVQYGMRGDPSAVINDADAMHYAQEIAKRKLAEDKNAKVAQPKADAPNPKAEENKVA